MNNIPRIRETLYIETTKPAVYPLLPAGRRLPASWKQTFKTNKDGQRSFDLHLVRGESDRAQMNPSVGKWRVSGIPPAAKGKYRIGVIVRVELDGSVKVGAFLKNQPLTVALLTDTRPLLPLSGDDPVISPEDAITQACPSCESKWVKHMIDWREEPFASCLDCGNKFELPAVSTSSEDPTDEDLPPELLRTLGIESPSGVGGLSADEVRDLQQDGIALNPEEQTGLTSGTSDLPQPIYGQNRSIIDLNPDDIVRLAGEPLPEDKRRKCPKCDAVISVEAERCEWCGKVF